MNGNSPQGLWYFTKEQLQNTPSRVDGFTADKELHSRKHTCSFIQETGQKLRLPQLTIATAIVFFHRFFARKSFNNYDRFIIATTCIFLGGKVEETPKKLKDVVTESFKVRNKPAEAPDPEGKEFWELKEQILVSERILLQTLGFDLSVEHGYRPLLAYVKNIKGTRELAQVAWNFVNDSLRTTICLQFPPKFVAAAAIFLASKFLKYDLPSTPEKPWYSSPYFQVKFKEIEEISHQILELYEMNKPVNPMAGSSNMAQVAANLKAQMGFASAPAQASDGAMKAATSSPALLTSGVAPSGAVSNPSDPTSETPGVAPARGAPAASMPPSTHTGPGQKDVERDMGCWVGSVQGWNADAASMPPSAHTGPVRGLWKGIWDGG